MTSYSFGILATKAGRTWHRCSKRRPTLPSTVGARTASHPMYGDQDLATLAMQTGAESSPGQRISSPFKSRFGSATGSISTRSTTGDGRVGDRRAG